MIEIMIKKGNRNYVEKFLETFYNYKPKITSEQGGLIKISFKGADIVLDNTNEEYSTHMNRIKGFGDSKEYIAKVILRETGKNLEEDLKYFATSEKINPSDIFLRVQNLKRGEVA